MNILKKIQVIRNDEAMNLELFKFVQHLNNCIRMSNVIKEFPFSLGIGD